MKQLFMQLRKATLTGIIVVAIVAAVVLFFVLNWYAATYTVDTLTQHFPRGYADVVQLGTGITFIVFWIGFFAGFDKKPAETSKENR
jgi:hypothetical protein